MWLWLALPGCLIWLAILLAPWQPWRTRERLETDVEAADNESLGDITVIVPARNEAAVIERTLKGLHRQGHGLKIVVVDDDSGDGTADIARRAGADVIHAGELPAGWFGKLWALEQGRRAASTPLILLLDADIQLQPGIVATLRRHLRGHALQMVSLMAELRMVSRWERLLIPAFVYFFKLLYPFRIANGRSRWMAAAAGGCVLVEAAALERIGGFASLREALIDDCTLAARVKRSGGRTWIGLTHAARSLRAYDQLGTVWEMVARSAFTQLRYSTPLLLICTALMAAAFWLPVISLAGAGFAPVLGLVALTAMAVSYWPTLHYYGRSAWWCLALPLVGTLYLAMTWSSALRYWRGERSRWKGRTYGQQV